jgi:hypothetical protein
MEALLDVELPRQAGCNSNMAVSILDEVPGQFRKGDFGSA